jgi:mono/diheme cytochrome c family protein
MMPAAMPRRALPALAAIASALFVAACGTESNDVKGAGQVAKLPGANAQVNNGATLFVQRCSGCHTLSVVGAEGGAMKVRDRERTDGPNFDVRKEDHGSVLYAIRNGGFSGAIMPQNIVVGKEAEDVAAFLSKYAGHGSKNVGLGSNNASGSQSVGSGNQKSTGSGSGGS